MSDTPDKRFDLSPKEQKDLLVDLLSREEEGVFPLSLGQQRLWFLDQLEPANPAYNVPFGTRLRGRLNAAALSLSIQEIVRRHAILRTTFKMENGTPVQVVGSDCTIEMPVLDLTSAPANAREAEAYRAAAADNRAPFNLATGPLLRLKLIRLDAEEHILVCVMHHIVCDGWSLGIFTRELAALYEHYNSGGPSDLVDLPVQYGDYAVWQREWVAGDFLADQMQYWKQSLQGAAGYLELPTDYPRPAEQTYEGASQTIPVARQLILDATATGHAKQATMFMVMLATFKVLIHSYTRAEDIVVGVPVSGRNRVELEDLIGFFVNTLVLRTDLSGDPRFSDLLQHIRGVAIAAFAHADLPFERLVEELNPPRTMSHNPVFQIMFSHLKVGRPPQFGRLLCSPYVVGSGTSPFDLTMTFIDEEDEHWWLRAEYNTSLFNHERIRRLLNDYSTLLTAAASHPELRVSEFGSLLSVGENASVERTTEAPFRKPLPVPSTTNRASHSQLLDECAPRDAQQQILLLIWQKVLGVSHIGIHDDFFDLGGHSLLAARLITEVQNVLGCKVPLSVLFRSSTIDSFSEVIRQGKVWAPDPLLMEIQPGAGGLPVYGVAAPGVDTLGYALLARHMGIEQPFYKLQAYAPSISDLPYGEDELQGLARQYIAAMRAIQAEGPYFLVAACGGVHIAEQMVLKLEAQGQKVGLLAIIDTWVLQNRQVRWLERINYYSRRIRDMANLPLSAQLDFCRLIIQRRSRKLMSYEAEPMDPWTKAYWPGKAFTPRRFEAQILLFKRPRQPYYYVNDPVMGWGQRSTKTVEIYAVDATHEAMLREPCVQGIAENLRDRMRRIAMECSAKTAQARKPAALVTGR